MAIGTAGYTAALCVLALERHGVTPDDGPVLVTGATGGVGSLAVALLATAGFEVLASTGKADEAGYLKDLGASEVVDRSQLSEPGRPLGKERWGGAVDTVGRHTLANVLAGTRYGGTVAACGLAQGMDLPTSVAPFILRGVTLAVDSVMAPRPARLDAWARLARDLSPATLDVTGGANVFPAQVEHALIDHPKIADVVVIGLRDEQWGHRVHAIVEPADPADPPDADEVIAYAKARLAAYKVPKTVELVDEMPRSAATKVNRSRLVEARGG